MTDENAGVPITREEEEGDAWEYWHQRALMLEEKLIYARRLLQNVMDALATKEQGNNAP